MLNSILNVKNKIRIFYDIYHINELYVILTTL